MISLPSQTRKETRKCSPLTGGDYSASLMKSSSRSDRRTDEETGKSPQLVENKAEEKTSEGTRRTSDMLSVFILQICLQCFVH